MLSNLQKYSDINSLIPFLLNFLHKDYHLENNNGIAKKMILVQVIEALLYNQFLNLEFHMHIVIQILVHFIVHPNLSLNYSFQCMDLRKLSAVCLTMIVFRYNEKYIELQDNICNLLYQTLIDILKISPAQKKFDINPDLDFSQHYQTVFGILKFFQNLQINILKHFVLPILPSILRNRKFQKDLYHQQNLSSYLQ